MASDLLGAIIIVISVLGYYVDYLFVRFLFRLGAGIAEWLGGPEMVGTGIGLLLVLFLLGLVVTIFVVSSIGIYAGYAMIVGHR